MKPQRSISTKGHAVMLGQLITFAVLVILDIGITVQVLSNGMATEASSAMRFLIQETSLIKAMVIKSIFSLVVICILYETWRRKESFSYFNGKLNSNGAKLAYQGIMVINAMYIFIVLNNLLVYTGQIEPIYAGVRAAIEWSKSIY